MLFLSILLALIPLAGIAWIVITRSLTSVDGLFMSLILLAVPPKEPPAAKAG
jgi:hypothetical protein